MKSGAQDLFEMRIATGMTRSEEMTDEQIEVFAHTIADVPGALARIAETNPEIAERIEMQQADVAEICRRAQ